MTSAGFIIIFKFTTFQFSWDVMSPKYRPLLQSGLMYYIVAYGVRGRKESAKEQEVV